MSEKLPQTMAHDDDQMSYNEWKELQEAEHARRMRLLVLFAIFVAVLLIAVAWT